MEDLKTLTYNLLLCKYGTIKKLDDSYNIFLEKKIFKFKDLSFAFIRNIGIIIFTDTELFIYWGNIDKYLDILNEDIIQLKYIKTGKYITGKKVNKRKLYLLK